VVETTLLVKKVEETIPISKFDQAYNCSYQARDKEKQTQNQKANPLGIITAARTEYLGVFKISQRFFNTFIQFNC